MTVRTQAGPKKRMPAADRREVILDSALTLFAEHGFHETSLAHVAERAGISKALIYEHFDSKQELHDTLIATYASKLLETVVEAVGDAEPGEPRLRTGVEAFLSFVEANRQAWRMIFRHIDDPGVADRIEQVRENAAGTIAALIKADAPVDFGDDGPGIDLASRMLAEQLVGGVLALANWWERNQQVGREDVVELIMSFAWVGLDRLSSGERWTPSAEAAS